MQPQVLLVDSAVNSVREALRSAPAAGPLGTQPPSHPVLCRMMADGVRKLQGNLAAGALAALGSSQPASPLESGALLPLTGAGSSGGRGGVSLPVGLPDIRLP